MPFKKTEKATKAVDRDLHDHSKITEKKLYYNKDVEAQVKDLSSLLEVSKFNRIRKRMDKCGFRKAFTCLFYGSPGTGKTESVLQIAKKTGRDVLVINVEDVKSKWVGDSEKNIKEVFNRYRRLVDANTDGNIPILLFNEADAILGIRKKGAEDAVDKMENSMQNIILQEMENLDGIFIATTNLTENLDTAFERRFLYKINFTRPDKDVQAKIWKSMIPDMKADVVRKITETYDLSGGQIENVSRKFVVDSILHPHQTKKQVEVLDGFCRNENYNDNGKRSVIGFR